LADYRDHYEEMRAVGAIVVVVSADLPAKWEVLRRELRLPFLILCDTERRVIQDWGLHNPKEKGGIAKPAVFVIDRDRTVRYSQVDDVATRVPPSEIIQVLRTATQPIRSRLYIPGFGDFLRALRNQSQR
jgi:peroxiredoxin